MYYNIDYTINKFINSVTFKADSKPLTVRLSEFNEYIFNNRKQEMVNSTPLFFETIERYPNIHRMVLMIYGYQINQVDVCTILVNIILNL